MRLTGLHLLLTYQCTFECDHCFVWGSPFQTGVMTLKQIGEILHQGEALGSITSIYFEGGEPFLYHPILVKGVEIVIRRRPDRVMSRLVGLDDHLPAEQAPTRPSGHLGQ